MGADEPPPEESAAPAAPASACGAASPRCATATSASSGTGQIVSLIGTWMQSVSQPWLVLLLGGSPLQLGTVLALQFAPAMVLAPLGGVLADRVDKRKVLMVAQVVAALQASVLFALTVTGVVQIWHVMVLATVLGFVSAVEMPVRQAFAAELVPRRDLVNAIALNSASFNLARVIGPAVAGLALAFFGPAFNFGINAVSYLAVLIGAVADEPGRAASHGAAGALRFGAHSLAEGIGYARAHADRAVATGAAGRDGHLRHELPDAAAALRPLHAGPGCGRLRRPLRGHGRRLADRLAEPGLHRLAPADAGPDAGRRRLVRRLRADAGPDAHAGAAYPLILVIGLSSMVMVNTINVTVQHRVPNELRGRVMSLYVTVFAGSAPIGGFFAGAVAEIWDAPAGFLLGASDLRAVHRRWSPGSWSSATRAEPMPARRPSTAASRRRRGRSGRAVNQ